MNLKILSAVLLSFAFFLSGCSSTEELVPEQAPSVYDSGGNTETIVDDSGNPVEVEITEPEQEETDVPENSPVFLLDGEEYTLPFPVSDLMNAGWALSGSEEELSSNSYAWQNTLTKDNKTLIVQLENTSMESLPLSACQVGMVYAGAGSDAGLSIGSFALGGSYDAFVQAMGDEPTSDAVRDDGRHVAYISDAYRMVEAVFDTETGKCSEFTIQWMANE